MKRVFARDGHLAAVVTPQRTLHDDAGIIEAHRGKQFRFGQRRLKGLDAAFEAKARKLWNLHAGDPINGEYVDEYLKDIRRQREFGNIKGVNTALATGPAPEVVVVLIAFR